MCATAAHLACLPRGGCDANCMMCRSASSGCLWVGPWRAAVSMACGTPTLIICSSGGRTGDHARAYICVTASSHTHAHACACHGKRRSRKRRRPRVQGYYDSTSRQVTHIRDYPDDRSPGVITSEVCTVRSHIHIHAPVYLQHLSLCMPGRTSHHGCVAQKCVRENLSWCLRVLPGLLLQA